MIGTSFAGTDFSSIPYEHILIFAFCLFLLGIAGLLLRRGLIFMLISVEIMLNSAGVAFVAGGAKWGMPDGQVMFIFIVSAAAAELAVALALLLRIHHLYGTTESNQISKMKG